MGGRAIRIGIDVGGTFTDVVADTADGRFWHAKVRSTPHDPAQAILEATELALNSLGVTGAEVTLFGHGTTVITNMILEGKGAPLAVVTTQGFRDVLELGRQARPHVYDYRRRRPPPLAARRDRFEVTERMAADGTVVTPLGDLTPLIEDLRAGNYGAVAVCLLHSYANPQHERAIAAALHAALPEVYVTLSHEVAPEYREFERFATTAMNAAVGPRSLAYLNRLQDGLVALGLRAELQTVTSNAGLVDAAVVASAPVRTALSGPAAGVAGLTRLLPDMNADLVTLDVGGTSTDIAVLPNGTPRLARERQVGGYPLLAPMVDIEVIGAGGGSLARVDAGGALKVGPESAGADPGPAAYGRGGRSATLTDALVVLGWIGSDARLGDNLAIDPKQATSAVEQDVAKPLDLTVEEAARGILDIACAGMARMIRTTALSRGVEPGALSLVAYGGAGPLVATTVAEQLGLTRIFVPSQPGTLCARAILVADIARDFATVPLVSLSEGWSDLTAAADTLRSRGAAWLHGQRIPPESHGFSFVAACRYRGQNFELPIVCELADGPSALRAVFDDQHAASHGFALPDQEVDVVTLRLRAWASPQISPPQRTSPKQGAQPKRRIARFGAPHDTPVVDRATLTGEGTGPLILEEATSTTVIPPGWSYAVQSDSTLILERVS